MRLDLAVKIFGLLDLCLIGWAILKDVMAQRIPFVAGIYDALETSQAFGLHPNLSLSISVVGNIALISAFFSGYLMIKEKKVGVYISFLQAPLRVFLVVPPTFFFIIEALQLLPVPPIAIVLCLYVLEATKILFQVLWLRGKRKKRHA